METLKYILWSKRVIYMIHLWSVFKTTLFKGHNIGAACVELLGRGRGINLEEIDVKLEILPHMSRT